MDQIKNTTSEDVATSIGAIYARLSAKRQAKDEEKKAKKEEEKELRRQEKEEKYINEDGSKMSKKEKREKAFDNWKNIVVGLTGDDLEYIDHKKKKKKYRKWIDDDEVNAMLNQKQKKPKKKNYNKEFEPELNMLKNLVAEQNKFTADLQKRFNFAAGPAAKDGLMPNKTLVELANVISSGRSNSLGVLREIGSLKKTIAELYMKQKKLDSELSGGSGNFDSTDLGLLGSSVASSLFGDSAPIMPPTQTYTAPMESVPTSSPFSAPVNPIPQQFAEFDPNSWDGPSLENTASEYEAIPHTVVVEMNRNDGSMRFKAVRDDDGTELIGCPVPTSDPSRLVVNEANQTVKGQFDEVYPLQMVG